MTILKIVSLPMPSGRESALLRAKVYLAIDGTIQVARACFAGKHVQRRSVPPFTLLDLMQMVDKLAQRCHA